MFPWIEDIRAFLPLTVAAVEADGDGVCLSGNQWRLRVNTNWRVSATEITAMSPSISGNVAKGQDLYDLIGDEVVQVSTQTRDVGLDLILRTRTGRIFEILSDYPYGEWIFSVWRPEDERQVPVFDLEGPVAPDLT
ncbi:hypothetical protein [Micromonospora parastrephiae]|uniref:hypothetical protein n=1 Tax=Micromonospora parastrephiae TaxID=2806101 RepID=UPI001EE45787|nr:hypothetical protein [Micromonospora parastrephiae]